MVNSEYEKLFQGQKNTTIVQVSGSYTPMQTYWKENDVCYIQFYPKYP